MIRIERPFSTLVVREDAPSDCSLAGQLVVSSRYRATPDRAAKRKHIILDAAVVTGPRMPNAVLGAVFLPRDDDACEVRVHTQLEGSTVLDWPVAAVSEAVRVRLAPKWSEELLAAASSELVGHDLPSATIEFGEAASGDIGGDLSLFMVLAKLITRAFISRTEPLTPEWFEREFEILSTSHIG